MPAHPASGSGSPSSPDNRDYPAPPLPPSARRLTAPLPKALLQGLDCPREARWLCLTYEATSAYLATDTGCGGTRSWRVYSAFRDHLAIRLDTLGLHFGSDDARPDHAFLLDQREVVIWVATYSEAYQFIQQCCQARNGLSRPLTPAEISEALREFLTELRQQHQRCQDRFLQDPEGTLLAWAEAEQGIIQDLNDQLTQSLPAVLAAYPEAAQSLRAQGVLGDSQQLRRAQRSWWN